MKEEDRKTDEESQEEFGQGRADLPERVEDLLVGWDPSTDETTHTEIDPAHVRTETQRAVAWLRQTGERQTRGDFVEALAGESPLSTTTWWQHAVKPGLWRLVSSGLVEYREGTHDYKWVGTD